MTTGRGWSGIMSQMLHYLRTVGADHDDDGRFLISGDVVTFLGMGGENAETVVGPETLYYIAGHAYGLAAGLGTTSYGSRPYVII